MTATQSLLCKSEGCERPVAYKGVGQCVRCYRYDWLQKRPPCKVEGCDSPSPHRSGYCGGHHHRFKRYGDPLLGPQRGRPGVKRGIRRMEGRYVTKEGYVKVRRPDGVGRDLWVLEHRFVMETHLGRRLRKDESIHHRNGDKTDNRLENLELWTRFQPTGQRVEDLLAWAHELIARYEREGRSIVAP